MKNDNNYNNNKRLARMLHEVSEHCQGSHSFCVKGKVVLTGCATPQTSTITHLA